MAEISLHNHQPKVAADYTVEQCLDCQSVLPIKICQSRAGFYIGTDCDQCGKAHNRFSGYTRHREIAERVLQAFLANPCRLHGYYLCEAEFTDVQWLCCEEPDGELSARYYTTLAKVFPPASKSPAANSGTAA